MKNWSNIGQVTVRAYNGTRQTYASLEDAVRDLGLSIIETLRGDHIGYDHRVARRENPPRNYEEALHQPPWGGDSHHLFDQNGIRIPVWKIKEAWDNLPVIWSNGVKWSKVHYEKETFRRTPVPGISCKRWKFSEYYRHPKTLQEKRWAEAIREDCDELQEYINRPLSVRNRGNSLPTTWDDIPRSSSQTRKSWKNYRKYQWHE